MLGLPVGVEAYFALRALHERLGRATEEPTRPANIIAISRQRGAGGRQVARLIGGVLGWPVWDKQLLDAMAEVSLGYHSAEAFAKADERVVGAIEAAIASFFDPSTLETETYLRHLNNAAHKVAESDCITVGRGVHLLLNNHNILRISVGASLPVRLANLIRFDRLSDQEALRKICERDRRLVELHKKIRRKVDGKSPIVDNNEAEYDCTFTTDRQTVQDVAFCILCMANRRFGLGLSQIQIERVFTLDLNWEHHSALTA